MMNRYWEAHDLVIKALTSHDEPFSWEGEYFQYRKVNVIPRCYQQPHPHVWMPTFSPTTAKKLAQLDYTLATFISGYGAGTLFNVYRDEYLKTHGRPAPDARLAYLGMVAVANDEKTALIRGRKVMEHAFASERTPVGGRPAPGPQRFRR